MLTDLLRQSSGGDEDARERLFAATGEQLKAIARAHIRRKGCGAEVGATSLLQDAIVKLLQRQGLNAENRRHFFFVMKRAIRDVLAERLRASGALKRGGDRVAVPLGDEIEEDPRGGLVALRGPAGDQDVTAEELHAAIDALEAHDPESAGAFLLIELYGTTVAGAAEALGRTVSQTRDDNDYARAWLSRRLGGATAR